jgi:hypothetical protein
VKYFSILITNQHLSPSLGDMTKPTRPKNSKTTSPIAKKSKSVKKVESAKSTPEENFTKLIELNKTKGPVPFRPTQRDYKRQEKLVSADSLSEIAFDDGLLKDEADLNGFVRWILRCQAKHEAGVFKTLVRPLSNLPEKPPSRPQGAFPLLTGNSLRRPKNEEGASEFVSPGHYEITP